MAGRHGQHEKKSLTTAMCLISYDCELSIRSNLSMASADSAKPAAATTAVGWPRVLLFTDSDAFAGRTPHSRSRLHTGVGVGIAFRHPSPLAERARQPRSPCPPIAKRGLLDQTALKIAPRPLQTKRRRRHSRSQRPDRHARRHGPSPCPPRSLRLHPALHHSQPCQPHRHQGRSVPHGTGWVANHTDRFIAVSRGNRTRHGRAQATDTPAEFSSSLTASPISMPPPFSLPTKSVRNSASARRFRSSSPPRAAPEKAVDSLIDAMATNQTSNRLLRHRRAKARTSSPGQPN